MRLRHTGSTNSAQARPNLARARRLLHPHNPVTAATLFELGAGLERVYAHLLEGSADAARERLDAFNSRTVAAEETI